MQWDAYFAELEEQFAADRRAERDLLATEAERLRVARLDVRHRCLAMAQGRMRVVVGTGSGLLRGTVVAAGAEWVAVVDGGGHTVLVPLTALTTVALQAGDVPDSLRRSDGVRRALTERMSWAFVLRDIARRRIAVTVCLAGGSLLSGTIDRAGTDHLDLALHDAGGTRRMREVSGFRIVAFTAVEWVRLDPRDASL